MAKGHGLVHRAAPCSVTDHRVHGLEQTVGLAGAPGDRRLPWAQAQPLGRRAESGRGSQVQTALGRLDGSVQVLQLLEGENQKQNQASSPLWRAPCVSPCWGCAG